MMEEEMDEEEEEKEKAEEEPVKAAPGKRKKEITKQERVPEAKKQKVVEGSESTTTCNHFIGNLNPNKSVAELKDAIRELFTKNDLAVVDVTTGTTRKSSYVDFESAEDLEKALELTALKVFGNDIKLEKLKEETVRKFKLQEHF